MPITSFKKQLETCFFLIHLVFNALSTGDEKSSLNTFFLDIYLHFHVIFLYLLYLDLICHHQWTEHEKRSGLKKQVSSCFFLLKEVIVI